MMLTLQQLKDMEPGAIIASGTCTNSPDDIYMTSSDIGRKMIWIAKRGGIHDWCIYLCWEEFGFDYCLTNGDKLNSGIYIRRLVPCDDESLNWYRR